MKKIIFFSFFNALAFGQIKLPAPKKLLDFGWNSPFTYDLRKDLKKYEIGVFDGVGIKLPKYVGAGNIFMVNDLRKLSEDSLALEKSLCVNMPQSKELTDNFVIIFGGSQMDWFSDEDWAICEKNLRYTAQIAKMLKCKGLYWDAEPYKPGKNPWKYPEQPGASIHTYEEYAIQVRKRGAQFITAIQQEFPDLIVYSLREFSDYQKGSPFSEPLLPVLDPVVANSKLKTMWWGLHLPFTLGILDAIEGNATIVDANEEAYYYTSQLEFYKIISILKNDGLALVPKELHKKFAAHYKIGHAISPDYTSGNWANVITFPYRLSGQAKMLTPQQQAKWFEHNVYYSLKASDDYAWMYTEKYNWFTGANVPTGFGEALLRAKQKLKNGQELGFNVEQMLINAREKAGKVPNQYYIKKGY